MLVNKVRYVYDNNKLLGIKLISFDGFRISSKEYYVGFAYSLNEIMASRELADSLGITNINNFICRFFSCNAIGVVYFPQTGTFSFLESNDSVITWSSDLDVKYTLDDLIASLGVSFVEEKEFLDNVENVYEPENSMSELMDIPTLKRSPISSK